MDGLTFRFVFADESGVAPPEEAAPGAAARSRPTPEAEEAPAPRKPLEFSSPDEPQRRSPDARAERDERETPRPSAERPERRAPRAVRTEGAPDRPQPQVVQTERAEQKKPEPGVAERVVAEMVNHLRELPAIGGAIGQVMRILEPALVAHRRLAELSRQQEESQQPPREPRRQEQEPAATAPAITPNEPPREPHALQSQAPPMRSEPPAPRAAEVTERIIERAAEPARENPDLQFPVRPFERPAPRAPQPVERIIERERENPDVRFPVQPFERPAPRQPATIERVIEREREADQRQPVPIERSAPRPVAPPPPMAPAAKEPRPQPTVIVPQPSAPRAPQPSSTARVNNPTPGAAERALERLLAALGPLPAGQRELGNALRPLTQLGYTLSELRETVRRMEKREPGAAAPSPQHERRQPQPPTQRVEQPKPRQVAQQQQQQQPRAPRERREEPPPERREREQRKPEAPQVQRALEEAKPRRPLFREQPESFRTIRPIPAPRPAPSPGAATAARPAMSIPPAPISAGAAAAGAEAAGAAAGAAEGGAAAAGGAMALAGGPAGIAAGIAIVAATGVATRALSGLASAAREVDRRFDEVGHRLAAYDARIALSLANADVRKINADLELSERMGANLARRFEAQSRMDAALQKIGGAAGNPVLDRLATAMEAATVLLELIAQHADKIEKLSDSAIRSQFPVLSGIFDLLKRLLRSSTNPNLDPNADIMGIFGGAGNARLIVEGLDFGPINNPITPQPFRGKPPKAKKGP